MNTLFRESFTKDLQATRDKRLLQRVRDIIVAIEQASSLGEIANLERLHGGGRYYRIRVADFRIGMRMEGDTVTFVRFLHRKDIYRHFP